MNPRAVVLATVTALAPLAVVAPAVAGTTAQGAGDGSLRIGGSGGSVLARATWDESSDVLCVHASRREAVARFRTPSGRVVSVTDFSSGGYWTCTNLDVPEGDRVKLVLRWKNIGVDQYARSASTRITT